MSDPVAGNHPATTPAGDLPWTAVRAAGPGGQNVNKVSSKIELRFAFERTSALDAETKSRLRSLAGSKLGADGDIVVVSQATRDRQRNLEDARSKLRDL